MSKNLKKRIITSIFLFLLLFVSFLNNFILGYVLIVVGLFSILEFLRMTEIIFNKSKIKKVFINLIFLFYIFSFCTIFLNLSSSLHLKILIFTILLTCVASDIGGFTFGKIFKGPRLSKISPKKTISGAAGSLILSAGFIFLLIFYLTKNFEPSIIIVGIVTSISCQLGDLLFSIKSKFAVFLTAELFIATPPENKKFFSPVSS